MCPVKVKGKLCCIISYCYGYWWLISDLAFRLRECNTAKKVVFTRSENKLWIFANAPLFTHFLTFSEKKIQRSPVVFESANWSIRSIIQQFSSTVNSMKTIVFLVLRVRLTDGKTVCIPLFTGVFPVTKHCFHRRFPLKTMRFLPFSRTVNA